MIREGELTIVELADQLGHAATETLKTYAHVFARVQAAVEGTGQSVGRRGA
jgi:hypothetical protein